MSKSRIPSVFSGFLAVGFAVLSSANADPAVQYVSANAAICSDSNSGSDLEHPKATIAAAVAALGENGGTVYVDRGEYQFDPPEQYAPLVTLSTPVEVVGLTSNAADVVIRRGTTEARGFKLEHEGARLRYLTIKGMFLQRSNSTTGGGIDMSAGAVEDCIVCDTTGGHWDSKGAGIYMTGGRVSRCVLRNNTLLHEYPTASWANQTTYGAAIYAKAGLVEDCLIVSNNCGFAGAVYLSGTAAMLNCTIADNTSYTAGRSDYMDYSGVRVDTKGSAKVVNCAIFGNRASESAMAQGYHVFAGPQSAFIHCAADLAIGGASVGCVTGSPAFLEAGNYHITPNSCCFNAGTDTASYGAVSGTDLDGMPRVASDAIDIGCYECAVNSLAVGFSQIPSGGFTGEPLSFALNVVGAQGVVTYAWDMDGDGTVDATTYEPSCTWTYATVGDKRPGVTVTDGAGSSASISAVGVIYIAPRVLYADAANAEGQAFPYDTPETAAVDLQTAIDVAGRGSKVLVADGEYVRSVVAEPCFEVLKDITVLSLSGDPSKCVLRNGANSNWNVNKARRVLRVNSGSAFVAGFTLSGGHCQSESGSGVYIGANGGTVSNCVIQGCYTENWNGDGAGAYVSRQGLLVDSVIRECRFGPSTFFCQDTMSVLAVYGTVENCLVCDCNDATYMQNIVGVHSGGRLVNCTVANCTCRPDFEGKNASTQQIQAYPRRVGVWAETGSSIVNCAVLGVRRETEPGSGVMEPAPWRDAAASFDHCATEGEAVNATCLTADTSAFRDFASGDYRLASTGSNPLVNAGAAVALHTTLDMARKPRVMCRDIDIGCYEDQNAGMVILCR